MADRSARSLARIDRNDLLRLAKLAADVEAGLFARHPQGAGRYSGRLLCRALCQGAALHYLNASNGVKDFDIWSFYSERDDGPFPYRWRGTADYGPSKFGRYPDDPPSFTGRRVDLLGRSLAATLDADPAAVLRNYLSATRARSAKELAAKAVVLINPEERAGEIVWPEAASQRHAHLPHSARRFRGNALCVRSQAASAETPHLPLLPPPGRGHRAFQLVLQP